MEPSDFELLDRWKAGDTVAGNELFERHFESVYRFFCSKADGESADLVQRTFLACVEARDRFLQKSSFKTFLFAIARHELYAHFRKRRPQHADIGSSSVAELSPSPSTLLRNREEDRVLLEALRSLPLDLQVVLELHYWEDLSGAELAEILELPEGTIRSRLRKAKEVLKQAVEALESSPQNLLSTLQDLDAWATSLRLSILRT